MCGGSEDEMKCFELGVEYFGVRMKKVMREGKVLMDRLCQMR